MTGLSSYACAARFAWLPALVLWGCSSDAPSPAPATQSAQPAPTTTATASAAQTLAPSAPAAPPAAPAFTETPEPALAEWATSQIVTVRGSSKNSCDTRMVREWLRVQCVDRSPERGTPSSIEVTRGRAPKERYQGENLSVVNDITTLIVPVRPGVDFAATFSWQKSSDELTVRWPQGAPESAREMVFASASATAEGAAGVADPAPPGDPAPAPAPAEPTPEEPQADVEGLAAEPTEEEWAQAPEARVKGSTAAGCETKLVGSWFRARCEAKGGAKPVQTITPLRGHKKTQTKVSVAGDVATFVTPYTEGTEAHARFAREGETHVLVLRWPKGKQPDTIGAFEKPR